jgi:pSer/pThr/pTyr-binding forkhead associated (FHA) protein
VHARFVPVGEAWAVQDNASKNGTFLNGRRVERAVLTHGDTIRIGQTVLTYEER